MVSSQKCPYPLIPLFPQWLEQESEVSEELQSNDRAARFVRPSEAADH